MSDGQDQIETMPEGWAFTEKGLYRAFQFDDFASTFDFMKVIADIADKMNHHPDWSNSYNKLEIYLFTHSKKAITKKDFLLAKSINDQL